MDPGTRRFVSIVMVAMLLLVGLLSVLMVLPDPEADDNGEEEDPGWEIEEDDWGESILVYDDSTWTGWDQAMTHPVHIGTGVTLTIEESHLRVPLEAMVFRDAPPFHVEPRGRLVLRNTTVEVEADPELATAMLAPYVYESDAPVIWRVVNLREAVEPSMEVDVTFMRGRSYLVVAAQSTPDEPLRPLEVLEPDEVELFEWMTLNVSLSDYVGGTPRVAIFGHNSYSRDVMVSDIRVTDRGSSLAGDIEPTGDLRSDGWTVEHFSGFLSSVPYGEFSIQPLVSCYGDLRVEDSRVLSLPGLERQVRRYRPQMPGVEGTTWKAPEDGCINVTGDVTFLSSEVAFAPIKWTGGSARFEGCSFSGDCDLVTLAGWNASVRSCSFDFDTPEGLWGSGLQDAETWLLALENTGDQAPVEDCTFTGEGEGIGLVVNEASVLIERCSFSDLALGVWDHRAMIPMSWGGIDPTVTFSPSCGLYYMETWEVQVELNGPDEPQPWDPGYTRWSIEWVEEVPGLEDLYMMEDMNDHYSRFTLPVMVVGPEVGEVVLRELEVIIRPDWADHNVNLTLDPHERHHTLWIYPEDGTPGREEHYVFWDWSLDVGEDVGMLMVRLGVSIELSYFSEPYLNISIDGELVDRLDLDDTTWNWPDSPEYMVVEQAMPPGAHNLTITAGATYTELDLVLEMDRLTAWVYRASEGDVAEEARQWLNNRSLGALMVDGGVHLDGVSYEGVDDMYGQTFFVLTWEGAEVDVVSLNAPSYWSMLTMAGNGTVTVGDMEIFVGTLRIKNVTAIFEGTSSEGYLFLSLHNSSLRLRGVVDVVDLYLNAWNSSSLMVEDVELRIWEDLDIMLLDSDATFIECTFLSTMRGQVEVGTAWRANLSIDGSEFLNVPLDVEFYDLNDTVSITGCTFEGRRGRMTVLVSESINWLVPGDQVPLNGTVSGNVFSGAGADLVVQWMVQDRLLGVSHLLDGARAYVVFDPELDIQGGSLYVDYNATTTDAFEYQRAGPISRSWEDNRLNLLVDVTEDPTDLDDPGPVTLVVRVEYSSRGPSGSVIGFADVDLSSPVVTVHVIDWDDMEDEIRLLIQEFDIEDNWWKQ